MFDVQPIESLDLPALAPYRSMRWQREHREAGLFIAEGEKVVRRLLESPLEVISLLLPPDWASEYRPLLERRPETVQVFTAEKRLLEQLTGFSMYQGVLGLGRVPHAPCLEELLARTPRPWLLFAADSLTNAENMGGLVRNGAAFGAHGLIVNPTCCSPYLRRAVRSSMGTIFKLPVIETFNLAELLGRMRGLGIRSIAAHPHTDRRLLSQADFTGDCCIVLGAEGPGLSEEVLAACDDVVAIPMHNAVDSLNVGTAGALFLYEAQRQRGAALTP
jgi:tRNA G18 (ribose-2'-O)-methylase SpoU